MKSNSLYSKYGVFFFLSVYHTDLKTSDNNHGGDIEKLLVILYFILNININTEYCISQ